MNELTQVKSTHDEHTQEFAETMAQFVGQAGSVMSEMHGSLEQMTEQAIGQVGSQFAEQAVESLVGSSGPLHDAFEALQSTIGGSHENFLGKFEEIAGKVEDITNVLKPIEPVIDAIKAIA